MTFPRSGKKNWSVGKIDKHRMLPVNVTGAHVLHLSMSSSSRNVLDPETRSFGRSWSDKILHNPGGGAIEDYAHLQPGVAPAENAKIARARRGYTTS